MRATKGALTTSVAGFRTVKRPSGKGRILAGNTVRMIERRYRVVTMRREGWSFREIADTLGCAIETVSSDLREVLNHAISELGETTEEARQLEVERLDEIMKEYYIKATGGDMAAAALVLSIGDRRRKLMALDKPEAREEVKIGIRIYPGVNTDLI